MESVIQHTKSVFGEKTRGPRIPDVSAKVVARAYVVFEHVTIGLLVVFVADLDARPQIVPEEVVSHGYIVPTVDPDTPIPPFVFGGVQVIGDDLVPFYENVHAILNQNAAADVVVGMVVPDRAIRTLERVDAGPQCARRPRLRTILVYLVTLDSDLLRFIHIDAMPLELPVHQLYGKAIVVNREVAHDDIGAQENADPDVDVIADFPGFRTQSWCNLHTTTR